MINREKSGMRNVTALIILLASTTFITIALPHSPMMVYVNDKFSAINVDSYRHTQVQDKIITIDEEPLVILDGNPIPYTSLKSINPADIESMSVWKDNPEYPHGVIEIRTKQKKTTKH